VLSFAGTLRRPGRHWHCSSILRIAANAVASQAFPPSSSTPRSPTSSAGPKLWSRWGGAAEDKRTRAVLRNARAVYLRVSYDEAISRIQGDRFRPLLSRPDLDNVYERRLPLYQDVSVFTIDTDGRRPDAIALEVLAELTRLPSTPPRSSSVLVTPVGGSYYAHIGPGLADRVDTLLPAVEQQRQLITGLGLPAQGEFKLQDMLQAWMRDKKYRHGIRFVVLNKLGQPESGVTADQATLEGVLSDLAGR
jgi:Shikimate kinase